MTAAIATILDMISIVRRRWTMLHLWWYTAIGLSVFLGWLLVMIVLDNVLMLPSAWLLAGWGAIAVAALVWAALFAWRMTWGRPNAIGLAHLFENRPQMRGNRLINALQMIVTSRIDDDVMAQALVLENAAALEPRDAPGAVDLRPLRRAVIALAIALGFLTAYSVVLPGWTVNALSRLFSPWSPRTHMLATDITVLPGDAVIVEGQPLIVKAKMARNLPDSARIEYRVGDLDWTQAAMARMEDDLFQFDGFKAVWHPMRYRIHAGRTTSPVHDVELRYHPRVAEMQVTLQHPEYTGAADTVLKKNDGDISALAGTQVLVDLTASTLLARARIQFHDGGDATMTIDGARTTAVFALTTSGSYTIRLEDTQGLKNINPPRYAMTVEPDRPPLAVITLPGRDLILSANAVVELTVEAQDDYGLADVALQINRADEGWTDLQRWDLPSVGSRHKLHKHELKLAEMKLKVGDVLLYRAAAHDRREPKPNVGLGRAWSITVSEATEDDAALADQTRRLLDALKQILELQKTNREAVDYDREPDPIKKTQLRVRELTLGAIDVYQKALHPSRNILRELIDIADGPMVQVTRLLGFYHGDYEQRVRRKKPVLTAMDNIIERLEALIGKVSRDKKEQDEAKRVLDKMDEKEKERALKNIRDMLDKLRKFVGEQDKVIADTEELVRKADDFTDKERQKIEKLKGVEDKWAEIFTDSVKDIEKLTEQGFADRSIANDYKEMVEQIEAASLNLNPKLIEMAVPREQSGRMLAESIAEEMEMWLPNSPDHLKWMMEEPLDFPDIPMPDLPDQLSDFIGDLIEDQDDLNDMAEDMTSAWADSLDAAGWVVMDGPISNFSAVGKTGNQLPDDHELSGRAGEGRTGRSQGQMVEDVAKGLGGRKTPTRITNDAFEQGVVKELQEMAASGATGGGKARGAGEEGLQGQTPPPLYRDLDRMKQFQQRIRQKAQRVAGQLKTVRLDLGDLNRAIDLMKDVEQSAQDGRYADMFKKQQMVLQRLKMVGDLAARDVAMRVDRAYHLPPDQRRQVLDAMDEPVPNEYEGAVRRYFLKLSESP